MLARASCAPGPPTGRARRWGSADTSQLQGRPAGRGAACRHRAPCHSPECYFACAVSHATDGHGQGGGVWRLTTRAACVALGWPACIPCGCDSPNDGSILVWCRPRSHCASRRCETTRTPPRRSARVGAEGRAVGPSSVGECLAKVNWHDRNNQCVTAISYNEVRGELVVGEVDSA